MKPGYKQTEVGVIPEDWDVKGLGELAPIATGNTPPTNDAANYGDEFLFVGPVDMGENKFISRTEKMLSKKGFSKARKFPAGSILFVSIGSTIEKCGISSVELTSNQQINAIYPVANFSVVYLFYAVSAAAPRIKSQAGEQAVPIINKTQFAESIVPIPPLTEQRAIAGALSDVDALLGAQEALLAKKRDLKAAAMQQLLTGETRLPGFTGEWEETTFGSVVRHHAGNSTLIKGKLPSSEATGRYPAFSASGQDVWCDHFEHEGEAIVVSAVGSRCGKAFKTSGKWCAIANTHVVWPNPVRIDGRFLAYFINDEVFWQKSGTGQPFVLFAKTFARPLRLPHLPEQTAIAAVLSDMDAEIAALEAQMDKTRALKQGMMQELLTGRIRFV